MIIESGATPAVSRRVTTVPTVSSEKRMPYEHCTESSSESHEPSYTKKLVWPHSPLRRRPPIVDLREIKEPPNHERLNWRSYVQRTSSVVLWSSRDPPASRMTEPLTESVVSR